MTEGWSKLLIPGLSSALRSILRSIFILGMVVAGALVASACEVTDINEAPTTEDSSTATTTPGGTPTSIPSLARTPTQGPKPGLNRDDALPVRIGEVMKSRFSLLYPDLHFYTLELEGGTTYTLDITDSLSRSSVNISDSDSEALARNTDTDGNRASRIVWTAPRSDTYFVQVIGAYTNVYTLTVTAGDTARSLTAAGDAASTRTPAEATTPGISPAASPLAAALTFASVSAGGNHTCGVATGGAAYCWGWDFNGQLGNGSVTDDQITPAPVSGGLTFAMVSAGSEHTCGVTTGGAAYCWGVGEGGQLGNGTTGDKPTPAAVSGGLTFASVSADINHSCGVTTSGAGYCWGKGFNGQLGNGSLDDHPTPVAVSGGHTFASVSVGGGHTCGVTTRGATFCWGGGRHTSPIDTVGC